MPAKILEGTMTPPKNARFAIVATRWNELVVGRLLDGALSTLRRHGIDDARITVVRVPGAFEIPVTCKLLAESGEAAAIIALGCVIRGATSHFEYVAGEAAKGCGQVALSTSVPVIFGVLTTDTLELALERAGGKAGNKGAEAAAVAIEMASLAATLGRRR